MAVGNQGTPGNLPLVDGAETQGAARARASTPEGNAAREQAVWRIEGALKALTSLRHQGDRSVRGARLLGITWEESSHEEVEEPPRAARDAVKIAAKNAALCRVVFLVTEDPKTIAAARRQRSILASGVDGAAAFLEELIAEMWGETLTASARPWANGVGSGVGRERGDGTDGDGRNSSFDGAAAGGSDRDGDLRDGEGRSGRGVVADPGPGSPDSRAARAEGDSDLPSDSGGSLGGGSLGSLGGGSIADGGACSGDEAGGGAPQQAQNVGPQISGVVGRGRTANLGGGGGGGISSARGARRRHERHAARVAHGVGGRVRGRLRARDEGADGSNMGDIGGTASGGEEEVHHPAGGSESRRGGGRGRGRGGAKAGEELGKNWGGERSWGGGASGPTGSFSGIVSGVAGGTSSGGHGITVSSGFHSGLHGRGADGARYRGAHGSHSSSHRLHKSVRFATTIDDGGNARDRAGDTRRRRPRRDPSDASGAKRAKIPRRGREARAKIPRRRRAEAWTARETSRRTPWKPPTERSWTRSATRESAWAYPSGYPRVCWGNETEGISKSAEETEREERCRRRRRRCRV